MKQTILIKYAFCAAACAVAVSISQADSVIADGSFEGSASTTTLPVPWVGTGVDYGQDTAGALGSKDGLYRVFTGDDTTTIHQVGSRTIQVGDVITLDFWVNSPVVDRGFTGTLFRTDDGGATRTPLVGANASIALLADADKVTWEQANAGALTYTVRAGDAGIGQTLGVEFLGTAGFKGLDLVSLDVVSGIPDDPAIVLPASVSFTNNGAIQTIEVPVRNDGAIQNLDITDIQVTGFDAAYFSVTSSTSPTLAPAGGSATIAIEFNPGGIFGWVDAVLEVTCNTGGTAGTVKTVPIAGVIRDPWISTPVSVELGPFPRNSAPQEFTVEVQNLGTVSDLVISPAPNVTGDTHSVFTVGAYDSSVAPEGSGLIHLTFTPPADSAGHFAATLNIPSDDPTTSDTEVHLIATVEGSTDEYLMLHYGFEETADTTATDSVSGATLSLTGSNITLASSGSMVGSSALEITAYRPKSGAFADDPSTWTPPGVGVTAALWFNKTMDGGYNPSLMASYGNYSLGVSEPQGSPYIRIFGADKSEHTFNAPEENNLVIGEWTHIAGTYDGTTVKLYVNGVEVLSETYVRTELWTTPAEGNVGVGDQWSNIWSQPGLYDDVRLYSRVLTAEEIAGLVPPSSDPIRLAVTGYDPATHILSITADNIPADQTFHLEQSADLETFAPLDTPFDFDSTTGQPFEITVDPSTDPALFLQAFEGP